MTYSPLSPPPHRPASHLPPLNPQPAIIPTHSNTKPIRSTPVKKPPVLQTTNNPLIHHPVAPTASVPHRIGRGVRFRPHDLVLCKYSGYPLWPANVQRTHQKDRYGLFVCFLPTRSGDEVLAYWCVFSGEKAGGWVRADRVLSYHPMLVNAARVATSNQWYRDQLRAFNFASRQYARTPAAKNLRPVSKEAMHTVHMLAKCRVDDGLGIDELVSDNESDDNSDSTVLPDFTTHKSDINNQPKCITNQSKLPPQKRISAASTRSSAVGKRAKVQHASAQPKCKRERFFSVPHVTESSEENEYQSGPPKKAIICTSTSIEPFEQNPEEPNTMEPPNVSNHHRSNCPIVKQELREVPVPKPSLPGPDVPLKKMVKGRMVPRKSTAINCTSQKVDAVNAGGTYISKRLQNTIDLTNETRPLQQHSIAMASRTEIPTYGQWANLTDPDSFRESANAISGKFLAFNNCVQKCAKVMQEMKEAETSLDDAYHCLRTATLQTEGRMMQIEGALRAALETCQDVRFSNSQRRIQTSVDLND